MAAPLAAVGLLSILAASAAAVVLRVAQLVLVPIRTPVEDLTVLGVDRGSGTVTLGEHPDAVPPGRYSLYFSGEHGRAQLGEILGFSEGSVTRRLIDENRGSLRKNSRARLSSWFYESPSELVEDWQEVSVQTELGPAPAWLVPSRSPTSQWVVQVHGRGVDRREPLRAIPVFQRAGYTSLLLSYRNDGVAPESPDRRYALGDTEWKDVEAGIRFAVDHGARDIVLMGWSMGGALVLQAVTRSPLSDRVRGIVLDSPVVDWVRVLRHQAGSLGVPAAIAAIVFRLISRPWGRFLTGQAQAIDLDRLDFVRRATELQVPILLLHSESDSYVPYAGSQLLAESRPDIVTFEMFTGAGHTRLWNYDSERWESAIARWLSRH